MRVGKNHLTRKNLLTTSLAFGSMFIYSIGAYDLVMTLVGNRGYFAFLGYETIQIEYFANYPLGLAVFWFVGVWAALIGSFFLLINSRFSQYFFIASTAGQLILSVTTFIYRDRWEILGPNLGVQDLLVLIATAALIVASNKLTKGKIKTKKSHS